MSNINYPSFYTKFQKASKQKKYYQINVFIQAAVVLTNLMLQHDSILTTLNIKHKGTSNVRMDVRILNVL